jgi:hypothetical protein
LEETLSAWRNLETLIRIEATRVIKGIIQHEVRYYISDEVGQSAHYYKALARGH